MGGIALVVSSAVVAASFVFIPNFGKQETDTDLLAVMSSTELAPSTPGFNAEFPFTKPYCDGPGSAVFTCPTVSKVTYDLSSYPISPPRTSTCQYEVETMIIDCVMGDVTATRSIALVGDSHARGGYAVHEFLSPRCSYRLLRFDWCVKHNRQIEPILNSGKFDLVVLAQTSQAYNPATQSHVNPFEKLWSELKNNGIPTVVMKDNPKRGPKLSECVKNNSNPTVCTRAFSPKIDRATQTALDLGIPVVDFDNVYCPNHQCSVVRGGMIMWRDNGHISPFFHKAASPLLWSKLMQLGLVTPRS
jgi:hypothetical protein